MSGHEDVKIALKTISNKIISKELFEFIANKSIDVINRIAAQKLQNSANYIASNKYEFINNGVKIYNDVQNANGQIYSIMIEYGTGTSAEREQIGRSATFKNTGGNYWYVHESQADLSNYNYTIKETKDGVFYKVFGQSPKHIYTDAKIEIANSLPKWVNEYLEL